MLRSEVLAIVGDQFRDVRKKLDLQLKRTAQIQAQLDHLAGLIARIVNEEETLDSRRERSLKIVPLLP